MMYEGSFGAAPARLWGGGGGRGGAYKDLPRAPNYEAKKSI